MSTTKPSKASRLPRPLNLLAAHHHQLRQSTAPARRPRVRVSAPVARHPRPSLRRGPSPRVRGKAHCPTFAWTSKQVVAKTLIAATATPRLVLLTSTLSWREPTSAAATHLLRGEVFATHGRILAPASTATPAPSNTLKTRRGRAARAARAPALALAATAEPGVNRDRGRSSPDPPSLPKLR